MRVFLGFVTFLHFAMHWQNHWDNELRAMARELLTRDEELMVARYLVNGRDLRRSRGMKSETVPTEPSQTYPYCRVAGICVFNAKSSYFLSR